MSQHSLGEPERERVTAYQVGAIHVVQTGEQDKARHDVPVQLPGDSLLHLLVVLQRRMERRPDSSAENWRTRESHTGRLAIAANLHAAR